MNHAQELERQIEQRMQECAALVKLWRSLITSNCPAEFQFSLWLDRHSFAAVVYAVKQTAGKWHRTGKNMSEEYLLNFCGKVMNTNEPRSNGTAPVQVTR